MRESASVAGGRRPRARSRTAPASGGGAGPALRGPRGWRQDRPRTVRIVVHADDGQLRAFSAECTHQGAPVTQGREGHHRPDLPGHGSQFVDATTAPSAKTARRPQASALAVRTGRRSVVCRSRHRPAVIVRRRGGLEGAGCRGQDRLGGVADPSLPPDPAHPRLTGRVPVPGPPRPGDLRRQGEEPAAAAVTRTSRTSRTCTRDPHDGHHRRRRRVDRGRHRGRGAPARVHLDQGERPAVQRQVPGRQELPLPCGHPQRGYPRAAGDARRRRRACATSGLTPTPGRSARPSTCSCGSSPRGPAARGCSSAPPRSAAPVSWATSASARRPASAGSAPRSTGRSSRTSATSWPARPTHMVKGLEQEMAGGRGLEFERAARLRDDLEALNGRGEAGRGVRRRHRRRRGRRRRGPAGGRGPGVPRPRRPRPRAARLGGREGRGGPTAELVEHFCSRSTAARAASACRGGPGARAARYVEAMTDWLTERAAAGSRCGCRSGATRRT